MENRHEYPCPPKSPARECTPSRNQIFRRMPMQHKTVSTTSADVYKGNTGDLTETFLTYHQLEPELGSYRYQVRNETFEKHVRVALSDSATVGRFTFDDGYLSQLRHGARLLSAHNLTGLFFLTTGRIGRREGYMTWRNVTELAAGGHVIGSHSVSHPFLSNCSDSKLREELEGSRKALQDHLGTPIEAISIPGGRWNHRVMEACEQAGYSTVFTSDPWLRRRIGGVDVIGRFNITMDVSSEMLKNILSPQCAWARKYRAKAAAKRVVRSIVGDSAYHALWRHFNHMEGDD